LGRTSGSLRIRSFSTAVGGKTEASKLADEQLSGSPREKVANRLERWIGFHIETLLKPLVDLSSADEISGLARGVAYRLVENLGVVDRRDIAEDIRALDQDARGLLRRRGVRFGAYHIYIPILLKPAPAALATLLWALKNDKMEAEGLAEIPQISAAGRTSVAVNTENLPEFYRLSGFRILGKKAVRVDILERLADLIRPCIMWREGGDAARPEGGFEGTGFLVTPAMMSILGATHEDMNEILTTLGYRADVKPAKFVQNRLVAIDPAFKIPEPAAKPDESQVKTKAAEEEAADTTKPQDDTPASQTATPAEDAVEEEKTIQIWRPARANRTPPSRQGAESGKSEHTRKWADKPQGSPKHNKAPHRPNKKALSGKGSYRGKPAKAPPAKPLDPDSPFAKLAALKASLEAKND